MCRAANRGSGSGRWRRRRLALRPSPAGASSSRPRHARDDDQQAEGGVGVHSLQVVRPRAAHGEHAGGGPQVGLGRRAVAEVEPGERAARAQAGDGAGVDDLPAERSGTWSEADHVVGDGDRLGIMLYDDHRVVVVVQAQQQIVHLVDVVGVQSAGGLVEDVGDVGQCRAEVADHLHALCLAPGSELDDRSRAISPSPSATKESSVRSGALDGSRSARTHVARSLICIARVGDADPCDPRRARGVAQPGAGALWARGEGDRVIDERAEMRLHRLSVLGEQRPRHAGDETLAGHVDAGDLHPRWLAVGEVVQLLAGRSADRLVGVEEARRAVRAEVPTTPVVARDAGRTPVEGLRVVVEL